MRHLLDTSDAIDVKLDLIVWLIKYQPIIGRLLGSRIKPFQNVGFNNIFDIRWFFFRKDKHVNRKSNQN